MLMCVISVGNDCGNVADDFYFKVLVIECFCHNFGNKNQQQQGMLTL